MSRHKVSSFLTSQCTNLAHATCKACNEVFGVRMDEESISIDDLTSLDGLEEELGTRGRASVYTKHFGNVGCGGTDRTLACGWLSLHVSFVAGELDVSFEASSPFATNTFQNGRLHTQERRVVEDDEQGLERTPSNATNTHGDGDAIRSMIADFTRELSGIEQPEEPKKHAPQTEDHHLSRVRRRLFSPCPDGK